MCGLLSKKVKIPSFLVDFSFLGEIQMEKYDRVVKKKEERTIDANEIRITSMGRARNYITYAMTLLQVLSLLFEPC